MASFSIPLTGLNADSTALNTIANDLSNMNTTAFKSQSVNFSDLFYQQIGSTGAGNPIQVGAGAEVGSTETDFATGTPTSTGIDTDVALDGNGFFVVSNGQGGYEYSRAGDFSLDSSGNLVTSNGLSVMGYPAVAGVVNSNAPLTAISLPIGQVEAPQATSTMGMTGNLDSTTPAGTSFPAQVTVYDSLGQSHIATVTYTPAAAANTWDYSVSLPAADYSTAGGNTVPAAITGTMTFSSSGTLTSVNPSGGGAETVDSARRCLLDSSQLQSSRYECSGRQCRGSQHPVESARDQRHAHHRAGRNRLRHGLDHPERLYGWRISELYHRLRRDSDGQLLQRPDAKRRATGPGQRHQPAGARPVGQRRLFDHPGQRYRIGGRLGGRRSGDHGGWRARSLERKHLR